MRQSFIRWGALLAFGLAGCNVERTDDTLNDAAPERPVTVDTIAAPVGATPSAASTADEVVLRTAAGAGGPYLTDAMHRALYLLKGDTDGSKCTGECLKTWPPLLVTPEGRASGAPELQADRIGTTIRADGATQVTYNGRPLYRYARESGPGATAGQDVHDQWGEWYLVTPAGEALEEDGAESESKSESESDSKSGS